jgi:hypothetical protein
LSWGIKVEKFDQPRGCVVLGSLNVTSFVFGNFGKTIIVIVVHPDKNSAYAKYGSVKCGNRNAIGFDSSGELGFVGVAAKCNKLWQYGTQKISNMFSPARAPVGYSLTPNAPTRLHNEAYEDYDSVTVSSYGQFLLTGTRIVIWGEK